MCQKEGGIAADLQKASSKGAKECAKEGVVQYDDEGGKGRQGWDGWDEEREIERGGEAQLRRDCE